MKSFLSAFLLVLSSSAFAFGIKAPSYNYLNIGATISPDEESSEYDEEGTEIRFSITMGEKFFFEFSDAELEDSLASPTATDVREYSFGYIHGIDAKSSFYAKGGIMKIGVKDYDEPSPTRFNSKAKSIAAGYRNRLNDSFEIGAEVKYYRFTFWDDFKKNDTGGLAYGTYFITDSMGITAEYENYLETDFYTLMLHLAF